MTTPNWGGSSDIPESAANYSSLEEFAAKTEADWEAEITDPYNASATSVRDGLWGDLPTGGGYGLTIITEIVNKILPLDQIADWDFIGDVLTALNNWAIDVNTVLGDALRDFVDFLVNLIDRAGFLDVLGELIAYLQGLGGMTLTTFLEILDDIIGFFGGILDRSGFLDVLDTVIGFFAGLGTGILDGFLDALNKLVTMLLNFTDGTLDQFMAALNDVVAFLVSLIDRSGFLDVLGTVIGFFADLGEGVLGGFLDTLQTVIEFFLSLAEGALDPFLAALNSLIGMITNFGADTVDGFVAALEDIVAFFVTILDRSGFLDVLDQVVGFFSQGINLGDFTIEGFLSNLPLVGDLVERISAALTGLTVLDGIALDLSGLAAFFQQVWQTIENTSQTVGQLVERVFGLIPVSQINFQLSNLLSQGTFMTSDSVQPAGAWSWDDESSSTVGGCLLASTDGSPTTIYSLQSVRVGEGDKLVANFKHMARYIGAPATVKLLLIRWDGTTRLSDVTLRTVTISTLGNWADSGDGEYTVPAGVTSVQLAFEVTAGAGGEIRLDEVSLFKDGGMGQNLVDSLIDTWNDIYTGLTGSGTPVTGKVWSDLLEAAESVRGRADLGVTNASAAQSTASTAQSTANTAQSTANTAQTTANTAQSTATTANTTANTAQSTATTANNTANTAQSTATTANTNANTANTNIGDTWNKLVDGFLNTTGSTGQTATTVRTQAATVSTTASTANSNANTAQTTANTAQSTATTAQTTANTAQSTANTAQSTANTAQTTANTAQSTANTANTTANTAQTTVGQTVDGIVNGYRSWEGTWTTTDSTNVASEIASAVAALNASVAALQSEEAAGTYSGNSAVEDFSAYSVSSSLGGNWSQVYSGSGPTLGVNSISGVKRASWSSTFGVRTCKARYTVEQSATDLQKVGFVAAGVPQSLTFIGPYYSYNTIYARMNATGTAYVYAKLRSDLAEIGYNAGGGDVTLATVAHTFLSGATYWLVAGTSAAATKTFQLLVNGNPILTVTGASSLMGAGYRYVGFGGISGTNNSSILYKPAPVASFAFYDNTPPTYRGSGFRASKKDTGTMSLSATTATFPNSWYTTDYITDDFTYSTTGNTLTVGFDGWYQVTIQQRSTRGGIALGQGGHQGAALYRNGSVISRAAARLNNTSTGLADFGGTFTVYCEAGDTLQPGYHSTWAPANSMTGEASGLDTYWTATFIGNKMPSN